MRFFHEVQFAGEKVVEVNQFRIALDYNVRPLFKRQPDIQAETMLSPGAALSCSHDAIASPGNDHVTMLNHCACEFFRDLQFGRTRRNACRSKNGDLPKM